MRTKALVCLAAVAAGALTAMAQSNVYSLNVVGYYNLTMQPGFNLVANQLNTGTNGIGQVLPTAPMLSQVLTFKNSDYNIDIFDGTAWLDNNTGNPSTTTLKPGQGFFFQNAASTPLAVTFVGEVTQGTGLTVPLPPNFSLVSSMVPQAIELTAANGFPQVMLMQYLTYSPALHDYVISINDGTQWVDNTTGNPVTVKPDVGQGFFISNPDQVNHDWKRDFTVQ